MPSPNALMHPCRVLLNGEEWVFDESRMMLSEYRAIKDATGLTRLAFCKGIVDEDPYAQQALVWHLRNKTKPGLPLHAVEFAPADLAFEPLDADPSPEAVPDETTPSPTETASSTSSTPSADSTAPDRRPDRGRPRPPHRGTGRRLPTGGLTRGRS